MAGGVPAWCQAVDPGFDHAANAAFDRMAADLLPDDLDLR
jgi:hypothetical protein